MEPRNSLISGSFHIVKVYLLYPVPDAAVLQAYEGNDAYVPDQRANDEHRKVHYPHKNNIAEQKNWGYGELGEPEEEVCCLYKRYISNPFYREVKFEHDTQHILTSIMDIVIPSERLFCGEDRL